MKLKNLLLATSLCLTVLTTVNAKTLFTGEQGEINRLDDKLSFSWNNMPTSGTVTISWLDLQSGNTTTLTAPISGDAVIITDPNPQRRTIFTVTDTNNQPIKLAERKIYADKIDNLRDMGGYITQDGKTVKWGHIYRADLLTKLDKKGQAYFSTMNVGYNFDLRSDEEVAKKPDLVMPNMVNLHTEITTADKPSPRPKTKEETMAFYTAPSTLNFWIDANRHMVSSPKAQDTLKQVFTTALNTPDKALVWHCSGGKDRTGFVSAVFLSALGVSQDNIIKDYLATNEYRKEFDANEREDMKKVLDNNDTAMKGFLAIQEARREFVSASLDRIKKEYGSVDNYLITVIGLTPEQLKQLKELYTE